MKRIAILFFLILCGCSHLPPNISMESPIYQTDNVEFYYDLTYKKDDVIYTEHRIFNQMEKIIEDAEEFIVMDVFLFNDLYNASEFNFPKVSSGITKALIKKKREDKDIQIYFITDEINTFYGVYSSDELDELEENGITVILTDLTKTNGANHFYSTFWRYFFSWFGTGQYGWLENPFSPEAPKVTIRSYLKLINLKGNHRKVLVTEKEALITSANPHSASGYHSNIGFKFDGGIINSVVDSEKAVGELSGVEMKLPIVKFHNEGGYKVQLLTEGKIGEALDRDIDNSQSGDKIYIGMFYLGDKVIVKKLVAASKRGVKVRLILDENNEAFGMKKTGLPNKVTGKKLIDKSKGRIEIKWYRSSGEQYHTKLMVIKTSDKMVINGGSANLTKRNIRDYTLDTNIRVAAPLNSKLAMEIDQYFDMLWNNDENTYTIEKEKLENGYISNKILYEIQNISGFSTY
ncbi:MULTISPECIES: phospholipase D family protein [Psychrilyobacter]|nr:MULTISPECIES: phospholipase D family protein [Psychrilyobacter]MCS5420580.1 phospholipase D family protein [Psychrilyobacter sp. S5]NDI76625.1 phospholipase [Psychrilyobacter piezotolerans]